MANVSLSYINDIRMELQTKMLEQHQQATQNCLQAVQDIFLQLSLVITDSSTNQHLLLTELDKTILEEQAIRIKSLTRQLTHCAEAIINIVKNLTLSPIHSAQ